MQQAAELLAYITLDGELAFSAATDDVLAPASVAVFDDPFYQATSDDPNDFGYEEPALGTLHGTGIVGRDGEASWTLVFHFKQDGSTITAVGRLPIEKRRPGGGVLTIAGGSGRFHDLRGQLDVTVQNPHRWTVN